MLNMIFSIAMRKTDRIDMLAAALLKSEGLNQAVIADMLDISQASVSRHLKAAHEYLATETRFLAERVDRDDLRLVRQRTSGSRITDELNEFVEDSAGVSGPVVRVFPTNKVRRMEDRMRAFGRQAAGYVRDLISSTDSCGVSWGANVGAVVSGIESLGARPSYRGGPVQFIPVCGEDVGQIMMPTRRGSSSLASRLNQAINGGSGENLSLTAVPAFIPQTLTRQERQGVWRLIGHMSVYERVFGRVGRDGRDARTDRAASGGKEARPLVETMSTFLTSTASAQRHPNFGGDLYRASGINLEMLEKHIIGDVSGCFMAKPGSEEEIAHTQSLFTGIKLEHIAGCAARARVRRSARKRRQGVVIVACGRDRGSALIEIARRGISNHWVIDEDAAAAVKSGLRLT